MSNLLLPSFSLDFAHREADSLREKTKNQMVINLNIAVVYILLVYIFRIPIIRIIFPGSGFEEYSWLFVFFGLAMLIEAIINVLSIFVKSAQRPEAIFYAQTGGAIAMVTLGFWLINRYNLAGAGVSFLFTIVINLVIILIFSRAVFNQIKNWE
jgi:O-antigen/teichoic acid export membrane protein